MFETFQAMNMEGSSNDANEKPILRFGIVADVQYADSDDRQAWYNPTKRRYYRNSLEQVRKAFQNWENYNCSHETPVSFVLQLGDIIDALNSGQESHCAIDKTLANFINNPHIPTFHTVGKSSHCFFLIQLDSNLFSTFRQPWTVQL